MSASAPPAPSSALPGDHDRPAGFQPHVPAAESPPEFTLQAVLTGAVLGIVFGASSLYLVLKVGMTVSASIPVAVLAITLFRGISAMMGRRPAGILENNITQTAGSAGESIAFGAGVTMPALMMLGFDLSIGRVMVVSFLGGLLGILMMIPLRRAFIVALHGRAGEPGKLLYPEGTACAKVLIAGESGGTGGGMVFLGFGVAFVHQVVTQVCGVLKESVALALPGYNRVASIGIALETALLGVGYIIGLRTAATMLAGAVVGYLVLVPMIATFGDLATTEKLPPAGGLIREMGSPSAIRGAYLLYIGAGCVAAAGLMSMAKTLPMIVGALSSGLRGIGGGGGASGGTSGGASDEATPRTDRDMPMTTVIGGAALLLALLVAFLVGEVGPVASLAGAGLILVFGFLFVTVSSRLTGEIGSSSNPISGMTVATLLVTCLIFMGLGWTGPEQRVLALSVAAVVCIAASNGGTTSQDLKTGFLVGGTPRRMQWAILIGAGTSALVLGSMLYAFNAAGTVVTDKSKYFPQVKADRLAAAAPKGSEAAVAGVNRSFFRATAPDVVNAKGERVPGRELGVLLLDKDNRVVMLKGFAEGPDNRPAWVTGREEYKGTTYNVWQPGRDLKHLFVGLPPGRYLVDDSGRVCWYVDPGITGVVKPDAAAEGKGADGEGAGALKFDAPKTQVMGVVINGVLQGELNWSLVLMGAFIAVALELCGVSSLTFAVGLYVPMEYSTPIMLGGLARWVVDNKVLATKAGASAQDEADAIARAETAPGVLLASGLVAGGSIGGVLYAFLQLDFLQSFGRSLSLLHLFAVTNADGETGLPPVFDLLSMGVFTAMAVLLVLVNLRPAPKPGGDGGPGTPAVKVG